MTDKQTPLLEQYFKIKDQHPDKILFFRMGDFYEMFGRDAEIAAPILGIALTSRSHGQSKMPLAGVPYHAAEKYLSQLIKAGLKVAVCEQTEDPKLARGLVRREVTEIITPGTITVDSALPQGRENMIVALYCDHAVAAGLAAVEITTGRVVVYQGDLDSAFDKAESLGAQEILVPEGAQQAISSRLARLSGQVTQLEDWKFQYDDASRRVKAQYKVLSLEAFELSGLPLAVSALGSLLAYIEELKFTTPLYLNPPRLVDDPDHVYLDAATIRNLEILQPNVGERKEHSLLGLLDFCKTAGGRRLLARWLTSPLKNITKVNERLQSVERLVVDDNLRQQLTEQLTDFADLERLSGKLGYHKANPRDLIQLRVSLERLPALGEVLGQSGAFLLVQVSQAIPDLSEVATLIAGSIKDDPPYLTNGGSLIKEGFDPQLDTLKASIKGAIDYIATLQEKLRIATGIPSLKVGYNQVFGYYIEVTRPHLALVPLDFVRKQTLVNAERFITSDLKEKEELILAAEEKINKLEEEIFLRIREQIAQQVDGINTAGRLVSEVDSLFSFATAARRYGYVKPELDDSQRLEIVEGRHPVIEQLLPKGDFVGNDTLLDTSTNQIQLLTGPNMAGKSTYLRQVGLIVIMAQAGSFVPTERATIGIVDRVFTRVGASDRLAMGESTFLVEMNETSRILSNATEQSLILLDEVGRGTSTYDGLAIAWALCETLHDEPKLRSRTVFATHFHELTELASLFPRIRNYQVQVRRHLDRIIFLRKVIPGGCDDSFGIEVAKLAGIPEGLTRRAKEILKQLEEGNFEPLKSRSKKQLLRTNQLGLFGPVVSECEQRLREVEVDLMTPVDALNLLAELKSMAERENDNQN
jgi:DNA mismatch repair protein MutS